MYINKKISMLIICNILFGVFIYSSSYSEGTLSIKGDTSKFKGGLSILKENKIELIGKKSPFIKLTKKSQVPDIEIYDRNSKSVKLNDLIKPKSAIHFWSITCAPCLAEMEEYSKFADKYESKYGPVIFISTDTDDKREIANKKFATLTKGRFKSYYFKTVPQKDAFNNHFMPQTIFYDSKKLEATRGISAQNYTNDIDAIFNFLDNLL